MENVRKKTERRKKLGLNATAGLDSVDSTLCNDELHSIEYIVSNQKLNAPNL